VSLLKKLSISAVLGVALGITVLGCAELPNSPVVDASSHSTPAARSAQDAGLIGGLLDILKGLVVKTLNLIGSIGGSLSNGRWVVVIPPNAVQGDATVYLGVSSSTSTSCQLEISPADKNSFQSPVTLTVSCPDVPTTTLKSYVILWWDPARSVWVPVQGSKVDLVNKTVSAPLAHFSTYSVGPPSGRAGW
jgi:hypothetical protein